MKKCCISSCPKPANLACYDLPTNAKKRKEWISNINREKAVPIKLNQDASAVCSLHFKESDYTYLLDGNGTSKRKISENAVPSVFPWTVDWDSNYSAEVEVAQPNKKSTCSQSSTVNTGLPEGEAVQLGNVESLGINTDILVDDGVLLDSSINALNRLTTENLNKVVTNSIQSKSSQGIRPFTSTSNSTSRVETSEDEDVKYFNILTQINYSCTGCEFKSKDIISLKDHMMKHHSQTQSESANKNGTFGKFSETSNSESPIRQRYTYENTKSPSQLPMKASRYRDKEKRHKSYSCTNRSNESVVTDSQSSSNNPSSASLPVTNNRQPLKRRPRNLYPCTQCSFRTPNAKKLKAHVRGNHPVKADTSSQQSTTLTAPLKKEIRTSNVASPDVNLPSLKTRRIKGHYYYLCPDKNCPFRAKDTNVVFRHYRANHPPPESSQSTDRDPKVDRNHSCLKSTLKSTISRAVSTSMDREPRTTSKNSDISRREPYLCESCDYSTNKIERIKNHQLRHTEDSGYKCRICSYSVPTNRQLILHVKNHHSDGLPCKLCDFKAKNLTEQNNHHTSAHKAATNSSSRSSEQRSNSECDLEHVCSQCSFKTSSRDRFHMHEKTHVPNTAGSSTEELEVPKVTPRKMTRKMKRKRESGSSVRSEKLIERLVYQCPNCSFWARAVSSFHQHLMVHEKTPKFKCSHCDFSARYRIAITKHIKKSPRETHDLACWIMTKSVPENQYPEYIQTALIPELEYSGTSEVTTIRPDEGLKRESSSNSSDSSWKLSGESSLENNSDEGSLDWVPSSSLSSANMKDDSSSFSENDQILSSPSTAQSSDSKSEDKNQTSSSDNSSSTRTSGIVLRSSSRTKRPLRKRLRIDSDDETEQQRPFKPRTGSLRKVDTGDEKGIFRIPDIQLETNMQLQIPSDFLKGPFPVLEKALAKRDTQEQMVREAQNKINVMRAEQVKMAEADCLSESELLKLNERKNVINQQLMKLSGQKIEAELELRTQQCQELKLSLAMYNPDQESESNKGVLEESKKLVDESEAKLTEITGAIANLRDENESLNRQIKENEESHAGTAQLLEIFQCEMSEKEIELGLLQEELAKIVSNIAQLVANERKSIVARTAMCEEELKRLYKKGLSTIRGKERDLLNALSGYVTDKNDSSNVDDNV